MTFDWQEYLLIAKNLYDNRDDFADMEACLRASISRSYYAAFCTARNFARDYDGHTIARGQNVHSEVKRFYINSSNLKNKQVGNLLDRLRKFRNDADYEDNMTIDSLLSYSETALRNASRIMELLGEIYPIL